LIVSLSSRPRDGTLPTPRAASRDPKNPASAAISSVASEKIEKSGVFHPRPLKNGPDSLERFQEKWNPVFRSKTRQNKELEHFRDSMKP
jgi:hypothetical protein